MGNASFYHALPTLESFAVAIETSRHSQLPYDWWIIVADVIGSTEAIAKGAYKDVNTVGVACIAAVINVDRGIELPFVFGGDGATFAVPEVLRERTIPALREAQHLSRESFGLVLRVGLVRVGDLLKDGFETRFAKVRLSADLTQATFSGRGWEEAERRTKDPQAQGVVRVLETDGPCDGSFEGFECRWQQVPSFHDHKLALLIAAVSPDAETNLATYRHVSKKIHDIYGEVASYHPLRAERMRLSFSPRQLSQEWRVRSARFGALGRFRYFARMLFLNLAGSFLFARKMDTSAVHWSRYKADLVENSDFRKFDGMLRMVMDGSEGQYRELEAYLESQYRQRLLVYGLHRSSEALLTCIVFSYNGNHMHFVDGSEGGYALAARGLKQQLKSLASV
jgi:hypothetical protein